MRKLYRYICVALIAAAGYSATAQNLDPTVVVDRAYEGKLMEVHKPAQVMAVPDSVMRFDLDFDYSVFESPFKGSYEFDPYLLSMKPSAATDKPGRFYLRAGAGYHLHPELDIVWSPDLFKYEEGFGMDVYARHRSFLGQYWAYDYDVMAGLLRTDETVAGYDLDSRAGVDLKYDWTQGAADLDLSYYGIHQGYSPSWGDVARGYNAFDASFAVASREYAPGMIYGLSGKYRFANDAVAFKEEANSMNENRFKVDGVIGGRFKGDDKLLLGVGMDFAGYTGQVETAAAVLSFSPHYVIERDRFRADIGLKVMTSIVDTLDGVFVKNSKDQIFYPDVDVRYSILPESLVVFFKADGGSKLNSYSALLEQNRHTIRHMNAIPLNSDQTISYPASFYDMGVSVERVSLSAGFEGRIGRRFSWNLSGGYANLASGLMDALVYIHIETPQFEFSQLVPGFEYGKYQKGFATLALLWDSERFAADGTVTYTSSWGDGFDKSSTSLKPAAVTGDVSFEYNYKKRVFVGVNCAFSTSRKGGEMNVLSIPGYADLGLSAEYVTSRKISLWLKGGNLLGMTIPYDLVYAQKGPYFTAGICLNL